MNRIVRKGIGPGTMAMFIGLGAFGAISYVSQPGSAKTVYFEADKAGKLRQVKRQTGPTLTPSPLWKPEPGLILQARDIGLTPKQTKSVSALAHRWVSAKSDLLSAMNRETDFLSKATASRKAPPGFQEQLAGYSQLSRQFESERISAWSNAIAVLSRSQREKLAKSLGRSGVGL